MSGKRSKLFNDPPAASSSEEEEDEVEHGYSSSEDNDSSKKPESVRDDTEKNLVSDSETGSDEESDHDSETEKKNPVKNPEPLSILKPIAETQDSKKGKSSVSKKRSSSERDGVASTDAKKIKRVSGGEEEKKTSGVGGGEETKKTYFQRVWTEEDEIAVLQRIIDYKTVNGVSPLDDTNAFYHLVKKSISFDVSKVQFSEKLRSLRKKFENKGKDGEEPTFTKAHDRKTYDLSKIIWGTNGIAPESVAKTNGKSSKKSKSKKVASSSVKQEVVSSLPDGRNCELEMTNKEEALSFTKSLLVKSLPRFGLDDVTTQQGWDMLAKEDKKRFEMQWLAMLYKDIELYAEKSGLIHEVVTKMAQALRSNP